MRSKKSEAKSRQKQLIQVALGDPKGEPRSAAVERVLGVDGALGKGRWGTGLSVDWRLWVSVGVYRCRRSGGG
jgi:hypothetical protein